MSPTDLEIVREVRGLQRWADATRAEGRSIALVPTMGSLHPGHLSLVQIARRSADRVVVSIFVNPKQFGPGEDFSEYPRALERDHGKLQGAGVDLLFAPEIGEMYPEGESTGVEV